MGADLSCLEPPRDWQFLAWDEATLRRFLSFVKADDEGSFRISKWKMLEFVGFEYVQEIARLFGTFASPEDTTVSSLHLAVALLLCNRGASVQFKVSECLSFFDWGDAGELTFYDLLFLLQACAQSLAFFQPEHHGQSLDALEALCREAMSRDAATLEDLARWAHANQEVLGLLTHLTPQDEDAGAALAKLPPPGPAPRLRGLPPPDAEAAPTAGSMPSPAASRAPTKAADQESPAAAAETDLTHAGDGRAHPHDGNAEGADQDDLLTGEPPLVPVVTEHARLAVALQQHLAGVRKGFGRQIAAEERRLRAGADAGSRGAALQRLWARALGASLPALPSSWTAPLRGGPFERPASSEALRTGLSDWAWAVHSAAVEEARCGAAAAAAGLCGGEPAAAAALRRGARGAAAEELQAWLLARADSLAEGTGPAVELFQAEEASLEDLELKAARELESAGPCAAPFLHPLRRDAWRLEGAVEYLSSLQSPQSPPEAALRLRREAEAQLGRLREDLGRLQEEEKASEDKRCAFLRAHFMREAFAEAARNSKNPASTLALQIQELRRGGDAADSGAAAAEDAGLSRELGRMAADSLEACEPCWRRAEGRLAAVSALLWGSSLGFQLRAQDAEQLERACRRAEAARLLAGGLTADGRRGAAARSPRSRIRLLERLLAPLEQAAQASPSGPLRQALPELLDAASACFAQARAAPASSQPMPPPHPPASAPAGPRPTMVALARPKSFGENLGEGGLGCLAEEATAEQPQAGGQSSGAFHARPGAGSEADDDSSEEGSDSQELAWRRALRFESRARRAALLAARRELRGGQLPELVEGLREAFVAADGEVQAAEGASCAPEGRREGLKRKLRAALDESLAGGSGGQELGAVAACVRRALRGAYAEACALREPASCGRAGGAGPAALRAHALPLPVELQLAVEPSVPDIGSLGLATFGLQRHAAHAVGSLRAMEAIRLAAAVAAGGTPATKAEILRIADLAAEARLLEASAWHRLGCAELEMRALAAAGAGVEHRKALGGQRRRSRAEDGLGPASSHAQALLEAAGRALAACRRVDVPRALGAFALDARLASRADIAARLGEAFGALAQKDDAEGLPAGPAPEVPPVAEWLLAESPEGASTSQCPRCLNLARLTWRHLGGGEREPPPALLERHATAWRLAALADSQLLASEALARGAWGHLLLLRRWHDTRRLAERLWRGELVRQHAAFLGHAQRDCLVRARDFLHALDPEDARFICQEDLEEQASAFAEDLKAALGERRRVELAAARDGLVDAKLRGSVLEGLREGAEAARAELHPDASAEPEEAGAPSAAAQVALSVCAEQALSGGRRSKAGLVLEDVDSRLVESTGALQGVESLRSFLAAMRPVADA